MVESNHKSNIANLRNFKPSNIKLDCTDILMKVNLSARQSLIQDIKEFRNRNLPGVVDRLKNNCSYLNEEVFYITMYLACVK